MTIDQGQGEVLQTKQTESPKPQVIHSVEKPTSFRSNEGTRVDILEKEDPPETGLKDYRSKEVDGILAGLKKSDYVHLDVTSGTGTSRYIIPGVINSIGEEGSIFTTAQAADLHHVVTDVKPGQIVIFDEFDSILTDSQANPEEVQSQIKTIVKKGGKVVFCIGETDKTRQLLAQLKTGLSSDEIPQITVRPKPFNLQQAREFFDTIKIHNENISPAEQDKLFQLLINNSDNLPLHFTWMKFAVEELKDYYQFETDGTDRIIPQEEIDNIMKKYQDER